VPAPVLDRLVGLVQGRRGVLVAGGGSGDPDGVAALAERLGWPVLADHRSGCRALPQAVGHADALLRDGAFADAHRPQVVLRLGEALTSKVVNQWLATSAAVEVAVDRHGTWRDPDRALSLLVHAQPGHLARCLAARLAPPPSADLDRWRAADDAAAAAIAHVLDSSDVATEPGAVRAALDATPAGGALVVASSMPVRDLEWFGGRRGDLEVFANRGANGIDGVVSTAVGVALTGRPTVCVLGDVALLHDSTALIGLARRPVHLAVVVLDNDGGGIFSFLPQAAQLAPERFEELFGTPHGVDLGALAAAHGLPVDTPATGPAATAAAIRRAVDGGGARVVRVRTDRRANVELHQRLERAVAAALR
jgi:2-succinyl-5-enolpyruvyl-6-hydroxy-3-cyclohexene-1-carboxylate synthase